MKLDRIKNTKRNIIFGFFNKIITLLLPFLIRTILIRTIGMEYAGLNGLFSSILQVLNLSELGFSSAIVFSMYKPIANNDTDQVSALLGFYRKIYRIIGVVVLSIGLIILPFLPYLIKGSYPTDVNIYILYLIFLANTVISYFLFAYKTSLLNAHQRVDIISNIHTITQGALYLIQIIVLLSLKNYYWYIIFMPVFTIINNLINSLIVDKMFPEYSCRGKVTKEQLTEMKYKVSGLMINRLCLITRNAFDSVFISAYLGLSVTAIYGNYYYIMNAVMGIMAVVSSAMLAGVGNSIQTETVDKNYADMKKFNFLYMWLSGWCMICLICLMQPFMLIWMGQENMFSFGIVILLCIYFYVLKMGDIRGVYSDAAGLWWQNRYRAILESVLNLILNFVFVQVWGVFGIILATLISLFFINFIGGSHIVFQHYFKNGKFKEYLTLHGKYSSVTAIIAAVTLKICALVPQVTISSFIIQLGICIIVPNILYIAVYCRTSEFKEYIPWMMSKMLRLN